MPQPADQLPSRLNDDLDRRLDDFDAAWSAGTVPDLKGFIPKALRTEKIPARPQWRKYVAELLTIDLEYRIRKSNTQPPPHVEDYYERIPWLPDDDVVLMEVIPAEYMARHTYGDRPGIGEYRVRFPHLGEAITESLDEAETELVLEDSGPGERPSEPIAESFSSNEVTVADTIRDPTNIESDRGEQPPAGLTRLFGNYELKREIARGGMGVVYEAIQQSLKRTVAVKVILAGQFAQDEDVRRFHAEAEAAAKLDHPNIVPIYEVGCVDGHHFFSMAYVDGLSLSAVVAQQPLQPDLAARVIRDVADAIAYAHRHGVIHRDLKPANILLEEDQTPRITDFGLSRQTNVESGMTVTGQILGTPSYMPPEQALGQSDQIDPRSDVYSLGATLYCLLTGRAPFQAANIVQTLAQVVQQDAVPLRRLNSDIPKDLENVCLKCLSKAHEARYQTAEELRDDLDRYLSGTPTIARPISSTERILRFCRRYPGTSSLIAVSTLLLIALASVSTIAYFQTLAAFSRSESDRIEIALKERQAQSEKQNALEAEQEAVRLQGVAEEAREQADEQARFAQIAEDNERALRLKLEDSLRRAEFNVYLSTLQRIDQLWRDGQLEPARQLNDHLPDLTLWKELHGWEWDHMQRLLRHEGRLIDAHNQPVLDACWSPDGKLIATAGQDRLIKLWDAETRRLHATLSGHRDWVWCIRFVGNQRELVSVSRDGTVRLWNADKGVLIDIVADGLGPIDIATISSDGRRWAFVNGEGNVAVWDLATKSSVAEWESAGAQVTSLALDPSGERLAIGQTSTADNGPEHAIVVRTIDGNDREANNSDITLSVEEAPPLAIAFSADAQRLAAGGSSDRVQVWNAETGDPIDRWTAHSGSIYGIQFGEDSDQLLTCSSDQTVQLWSIRGESVLDTFRGHSGPVFCVQMHPEGGELLSAGSDGTVRLWNPGRDELTLPALAAVDAVFPLSRGDGLKFLGSDCLQTAMFGQSHELETLPLPTGSGFTNVIPLSEEAGTFGVVAGGVVRIFDVEGQEVGKLPTSEGDVHLLCACTNGSQLAVADVTGLIRLFDVASATAVWTHEFKSQLAAVTFCHDDQQVLAIDLEGAAVLFETQTGAKIREAQLVDGARSISVSATQPLVAVGAFDGTIRLYRLDDLSPLSVLSRHQESVLAVQFHPDGRRLASAGSDRTVRIWAPEVRLWDTDQDALLLQLHGHQRPVRHVFWTRDGASLISVDHAGTAIRWRAETPN